MKRHPAFHALSRDHHDGLLLAIRLQQGEQALPRLWSHDPVWQAAYVVRFFGEQLSEHFRREEEDLFPAAAGKSPPEFRRLVHQLTEDHAWMRATAAELGTADPSRLKEILRAFGRRLEEHIRTEERKLFPLCERWFTPSELARVAGSTTSTPSQEDQT